MSFKKTPVPPYIRQSNTQHCWAAVFESLSRIEPRMGGIVDQGTLRNADWMTPHLNSEGGIDMNQGFSILTSHYNMQRQTLLPRQGTPGNFISALRQTYIVIGYIVNIGQNSHLVLAYGATDSKLSIMDPFRGLIDVSFTIVNQSHMRIAMFLNH